MEKRVLVVMPVEERHREKLRAAGGGCTFRFVEKARVTEDDIGWADIILGNLPPELLAGAKRLRYLQLESAGSERYVGEGILPPGVLLCNATGAFGLAISECMLAGILSLYKKMPLYFRNQKECIWRSEGEVKSIYQTKALVVGLGDIGSEFAKKIKALGGSVVGIRRRVGETPDYLDALYTMEHLDALLPEADIVALSLPHTKETENLFSRERLLRMKKDAVLVNVGRGSAVDTEALCDVLLEGHLLGAVIDVTDPEPLPAEHRLWGIENVILTPHATGGYQLPETFERVVQICAQNLSAYLAEKPMQNVVDFITGYRK